MEMVRCALYLVLGFLNHAYMQLIHMSFRGSGGQQGVNKQANKGMQSTCVNYSLDNSTMFPCHTGALGSPGFIAPETILGEPHTVAMDVFAVGVVLFVLLVGRKPFNISDSESLSYVHMDLEQCPGMQDPR